MQTLPGWLERLQEETLAAIQTRTNIISYAQALCCLTHAISAYANVIEYSGFDTKQAQRELLRIAATCGQAAVQLSKGA